MPFFGDNILYRPICSSTNTVAKQLLTIRHLPEETVIITDHQYQGKGQRGTTWLSEPYKNLTFSLILYPNLPLAQNFMLNIMTSLAIYKAIAPYIPHHLTIKWPNDIYYKDKKLSGLLIENIVSKGRIKASIIGIGLNVNQERFHLNTITSLALICQQKFDLNSLLRQLLEAVKTNYIQLKKQETAFWKKAYLENLYGIGKKLTFQAESTTFTGIIRDIDTLGRLVVEQGAGQRNHYVCKQLRLVLNN
jgi:BirA family biotin operon repressor/biotin-[acetyl-CoA-carboxylase] ligase